MKAKAIKMSLLASPAIENGSLADLALNTFFQKLYLSFWMFLELMVLLWPYFKGPEELASLLALAFLICVPFLLLLPLFARLSNSELLWAWFFYFLVSSAFYFGLPFFASQFGQESWKKIFHYQGVMPWLLQLCLLLVVLGFVAVAQTLRKSYDHLELRKGARDREELETFYEMKIINLPEHGLTPFRYKALLKIGVAFVAARKNRIEAAIQLLPFEEIFFLYDLCPGLQEGAECRAIDFLLRHLFFRPEIQLNQPRYLVYVARKADQIWEGKLRQAGFQILPSEAPLAHKFKAILLQHFQKGSLSKFEDWQPFDSVDSWYLFTRDTLAR